MKTMTERTTFALDCGTVGRLRRLSSTWHVSQAEVVRRAIALADATERRDADASASLRALHATGKTLVREAADAYLAEVEATARGIPLATGNREHFAPFTMHGLRLLD